MTFALVSKSKTKQVASGKRAAKRKPLPSRRVVDSPPGLGVRSSTTAPTIQTKLKIGEPNDKFEQEADRVADEVMRMPEPCSIESAQTSPPPIQRVRGECNEDTSSAPMTIQRICTECEEELQRQPMEEEEETEETIQAKETSDRTNEVTSDVQSQIDGLRGGGQPLSKSVRTFFESRFGHDFKNVRVHTNTVAASAASQINARAFTVGQDIVFGSEQYAPDSMVGKKLLAHELTHVVQQTGKRYSSARNKNLSIQRKPENECPQLISFTAKGKDPFVSDKCRGEVCRFGLGCCPTERGQCGSSKTSGMVFEAVVKVGNNCTGELAFMQNLTSTNRKVKNKDGSEECLKASKPHMDGGIPWKGCKVAINNSGKYTITSDDCPNRKLIDDPINVSMNDSFKTFLLWKSTDAKVRRPIANLTWGWSGKVTRVRGSDCASQYKVFSASHKNGKGRASLDMPIISPNVRNIEVGPCK